MPNPLLVAHKAFRLGHSIVFQVSLPDWEPEELETVSLRLSCGTCKTVILLGQPLAHPPSGSYYRGISVELSLPRLCKCQRTEALYFELCGQKERAC